MKYCSHCGNQVLDDCEICPKCGCRVGELKNTSRELQSAIDFQGYLLLILTVFFSFIGYIIGSFVRTSKFKEAISKRGLNNFSNIFNAMGGGAKACFIIATILAFSELIGGMIGFIIAITH